VQIKSIDALSLSKRLGDGKTVLIDIREPHEHAREHIEGAQLAPLSKLHTENFGDVLDKTAVFHCHSGGRTGSNAKLLMSKGFRDAYHLSGGIVAWKAAGLPTQSARNNADAAPRKRFGWLF
jgi:rhodanese-related sulfurtransferase